MTADNDWRREKKTKKFSMKALPGEKESFTFKAHSGGEQRVVGLSG